MAIEKSFASRKPATRVILTRKGRTAFVAYLDALASLVKPQV